MAKKTESRTNGWWQILGAVWSILGAPNLHRVLLHGKPGTGKSTMPQKLLQAGKRVHRVALTEDTDPADIVGSWALKDGNTVFQDGPAVLAAAEGGLLMLDEIDRAGPSCESILHAILDDPQIAQISLPDGRTVKPSEGFIVCATMNGAPEDLREALRDRFDVTLRCDLPHPDAIKGLPKEVQEAVKVHYERERSVGAVPELTVRRARAYGALAQALGTETALLALCGGDPNAASELAGVLAFHANS